MRDTTKLCSLFSGLWSVGRETGRGVGAGRERKQECVEPPLGWFLLMGLTLCDGLKLVGRWKSEC